MLETKLPGGPVSTSRYAGFSAEEVSYFDNLEEIEGRTGPVIVIDAWSIVAKMKQFLLGTIFNTRIA